MIAIQYDGEYLDLYDSTSLSIQSKSPLFGFESIGGSRIYSFKVPASPKNNRLLESPSLLIAEPGYKVYENVSVFMAGQLYRKGTLKLRDADDKDITLSFHTDAGDLASKVNDMKLSALKFKSYQLNLNPTRLYPDQDYCLPTMKVPGLYADNNSEYGNYINYYRNQYRYNTTSNLYSMVPMAYLLTVLDAIRDTVGYEFYGSFVQRPDVQRLIVVNLTTLDGGAYQLNQFKEIFNLANHMPDMTVGSFLLALRNLFGLAFLFSSNLKTVRVTELSNLLNEGGYKDVTKRTSKAYKRLFRTQEGFSMMMREDTTDQYMKNLNSEWTSFLVGGGAEEIRTQASPLQMLTEPDELLIGRNWTLPAIDKAGTSEKFGNDKQLNTLRLMYYNGLQPDASGGQFPKADYVYPGYSLRYEGGNGLYLKSWKKWLDFIDVSSEVEREINFAPEELIEFDFSQKLLIDGVPYYVKGLSASISKMNGLKPAKVTLAKIP